MHNPELLARIESLASRVDAELSRPSRSRAGVDGPVVFMCAEFGFHESMPIYSGGLGVLAGDILKEASDQGLDMIGIGLLYRRGYFRQRLDIHGRQQEIAWLDWRISDASGELLAFARRVIAIRQAHPVFRRTRFLSGRTAAAAGSPIPDAWWFREDGSEMTEREWHDPDLRTVGVFLNGDHLPLRTARGEPIVDDSFLVLVNGSATDAAFTLPPVRFAARWRLELMTDDPLAPAVRAVAGTPFAVPARSLAVLIATNE